MALIRRLIGAWALSLALLAAMPVATYAQMQLDLRDASLRDFVKIVAQSTGRNFVLDDRVQGNVTVVAPEAVSNSAIYEIFLNVLELNRLTIIEGDQVDRIVPLEVARELAPGADRKRRGGDFETRVIAVHNSPVDDVAEVIRPLLPAEAVLSTVPDAGLMILSDRRENFDRIVNLVNRLDMPSRNAVETITLQNGQATSMQGVISALQITPKGASISADARSNALVVSGPPEFRDRVRAVVAQLDRPQRSIATRVIHLNYADANQLADVIRQSFGAGGVNVGSAGGGADTGAGAAGAGAGGGTPAAQGNSTSAITIVAEPRQNALIITAPQDRINPIAQAIKGLDTRPQQVLVEAVIFELSVKNFSDLSFQFGNVLDNAVVGGVQFTLDGRPTLTGLVTSVIGGGASGAGNGGSVAYVGKKNGFGAFLAALASKSSTRLLSTPSILTLNNQAAQIVVAQNVPFVTGSFATVGNTTIPDQPFQTIERQDVGLTLSVTPQITRDKTVRMQIKQEVSNLTSSASAAGGEITARRELSTNVLVRDGHVVMLGGLLENGSGSVMQRVPGLSRLPLLGRLFKGRNTSGDQRILLVMLRPTILSDDLQARRITQRVVSAARRASKTVAPLDDGQYPRVPDSSFPFDGKNLNQPFEGGFVDSAAENRRMPPLPSRLRVGRDR